MKILYAILALVFLLFAALQWNDPDPMIWITGYSLVAVSCALAALGRYPAWWMWGVAGIIGLWMLAASPAMLQWANSGFVDITGEMKATTPVIEESREFLGLLIAFGAMLPLAVGAHRRKRLRANN